MSNVHLRRRNSFPILSRSNLSLLYSDISSSSEEENEESPNSWIDNFLSSCKSSWLLRVPDDYLIEDFNLFGLSDKIPQYDTALDVLRDLKQVPLEDLYLSDPAKPTLDSIIQNLYFLIHQRYVQSDEGLKEIYKKYMIGAYGVCPRTECAGQFVVPIGTSDQLGMSECCVYCPRCKDVFHAYNNANSNIDGASYGMSFGPLFFRTFAQLIPTQTPKMTEKYVFGFKVATSHQRGVHPFK